MTITNKNIFISPLDWGLGHTTRIIPIIKSLQELKANLYIGVNNQQKKLLEQEVDSVNFINFKGYNISYPSNKSMAFKMAIQTPKILLRINQEKIELEKNH